MEKMRENKKVYALTIAPELFETWKKLKRKKDPETIAEALGVSRPVIDKALLYGHVTMAGLSERISKFFEDRLLNERKTAERLNGLASETVN